MPPNNDLFKGLAIGLGVAVLTPMVLAALAPVVDHWYLAGLELPRGLPAVDVPVRGRASSTGPEPRSSAPRHPTRPTSRSPRA